MSDCYDVIVIGCGGIGSAICDHLGGRGAKVLGLEQFDFVHHLGSSHGQSRIIRQAYFEHPDYVPLLFETYDLWDDLSRRVDKALIHRTGLLEVGHPDGTLITGLKASLQSHDLAATELNRDELCQRFPQFEYEPDDVGFFEEQGGYLLVEECVRSHLDEAKRKGVELLERTEVVGVKSSKESLIVETSQGTFHSKQVVVSGGAWMKQLLPELDLQITLLRKHVHWLTPSNSSYDAASKSPITYFETSTGHFYCLPTIDSRGLKASEHSGGITIDKPTDARDCSDERLPELNVFLKKRLTHASFELRETETCLYSMSPDGHFLIDQHPEEPRLTVVGGFSGHGFKFCPVIGKLVAEEVLSGAKDPRMEFFRLSRLRDAL